MTPEEIRLKALTLATNNGQTKAASPEDIVKRARAYVEFIEERAGLSAGLRRAIDAASQPEDAQTWAGFNKRKSAEAHAERMATLHALHGAIESDPIQMARKALYDVGGIELRAMDLGGAMGRMVPMIPNDPTLRARADAYNALADLHAKQSAEVFHIARRADIGKQTGASDFLRA